MESNWWVLVVLVPLILIRIIIVVATSVKSNFHFLQILAPLGPETGFTRTLALCYKGSGEFG